MCNCIKVNFKTKYGELTSVFSYVNEEGIYTFNFYANEEYFEAEILNDGESWVLYVNGQINGFLYVQGCPVGSSWEYNTALIFQYFSTEDCPPQTITYSTVSQGWNSFWSFDPDWMSELNNVFYSFNSGDLWEHNINPNRNNFYDNQYKSRIKTIFNASPLENKLFKNICINSNESWSAFINTNLQSAETPYSYFIEKEGFWYAYIRNIDNTISIKSMSTQGVGNVTSVTSSLGVATMTFNFKIDRTSVSIGDKIYKKVGSSLVFLGDITNVTDTTISILVTTLPIANNFIVCVKNSQVESYGVRGVYMDVMLENDSIDEVELFSISSTAFKSFQ